MVSIYVTNDNTKKAKIQDGKYKPAGQVTTYKQGNNYMDVVGLQRPTKVGIKKLNKTEYLELSSGEIKEFNFNNKKQKRNLLKTFENLRRLIRTNFDSDSQNQLFVTLTYAENMQDSERLYKDFDKFMKRLKYKFTNRKFEYIAVAEPQGRGAWHFHIMLKDTLNSVLFIDYSVLNELWGLGYVDVKKLNSDDVGTYYVTYFTDLYNEKEKKRNKRARLSFYPTNFKFYRCSRGIEKPVKEKRDIKDVTSEYGLPRYEKSYDLIVGDETKQSIYKATFKK